MALQFALRPRFRLDEDVAPPPQRRRLQVPSVALPIAMYWLALTVVTYALIHGARSDEPPEEWTSAAQPLAAATPIAQDEPAAAPVLSGPRVPEATELAQVPRNSAEADPEPPAPHAPEALTFVAPAPAPASVPAALPDALAEDDSLLDMPSAPGIAPRSASRGTPRDETSSAKVSSMKTSSESFVRAAPPPETSRAADALPSCEAASAAYSQNVDFAGARGAPDLSREAFASILDNGAYLSACGVPEHTALDICVAVQDGRVKGVTVVARPRSAAITRCVQRAVASLRFPHSSKLDVTRTRFDAPSGR